MTQEDKKLLLQDLCARLPYRVKVLHEGEIKEIQYIEPLYNEVKLLDNTNYNNLIYEMIYEIKPYLRPMSSMTEEEKDTYHSYCECIDKDFNGQVLYFDTIESFDYLNSIHVDYRSLIGKGLAIAVTKENNPYK